MYTPHLLPLRPYRPPSGRRHQRRVIVSTPIAESSITIDGVTAVVDAGLVRCPEYNAATGLTRLITQRISVDSAEQRAGRAGRTQPGVLSAQLPVCPSACLPARLPAYPSVSTSPSTCQPLHPPACPSAQHSSWRGQYKEYKNASVTSACAFCVITLLPPPACLPARAPWPHRRVP